MAVMRAGLRMSSAAIRVSADAGQRLSALAAYQSSPLAAGSGGIQFHVGGL
jgi:hypothetical protein